MKFDLENWAFGFQTAFLIVGLIEGVWFLTIWCGLFFCLYLLKIAYFNGIKDGQGLKGAKRK